MPESIFTTDPPPRKSWRKQFRLGTLLIAVSLAAAVFAWARTWPSGTFGDIAYLAAALAVCASPPLLARWLIQTEIVRSKHYLWTLMIAQAWQPLFYVALLGAIEYRYLQGPRFLGLLLGAGSPHFFSPDLSACSSTAPCNVAMKRFGPSQPGQSLRSSSCWPSLFSEESVRLMLEHSPYWAAFGSFASFLSPPC
ncbi:MAG: hypothetical protein QM775_13825 [Pirellulales bacterium]